MSAVDSCASLSLVAYMPTVCTPPGNIRPMLRASSAQSTADPGAARVRAQPSTAMPPSAGNMQPNSIPIASPSSCRCATAWLTAAAATRIL